MNHGMRADSGAIEDVWIDDDTFEPSFRTSTTHRRWALRQRLDRPARRDAASPVVSTSRGTSTAAPQRGHTEGTSERRRGCPSTSWPGPTRAGAAHDIVITESGHHQPGAGQGGDLRGILGALPQRRRGARRRRADPRSAAPSASTSTSRRRCASACCPTCPVDRFRFLGNTSVLGAYLALLCLDVRTRRSLDVARQDDLPRAVGRQHLHGRVHVGPVPAAHRPRPFPRCGSCSRRPRERARRAPRARPIRTASGPTDHHHRDSGRRRYREDDARRPAGRRQAAYRPARSWPSTRTPPAT